MSMYSLFQAGKRGMAVVTAAALALGSALPVTASAETVNGSSGKAARAGSVSQSVYAGTYGSGRAALLIQPAAPASLTWSTLSRIGRERQPGEPIAFSDRNAITPDGRYAASLHMEVLTNQGLVLPGTDAGTAAPVEIKQTLSVTDRSTGAAEIIPRGAEDEVLEDYFSMSADGNQIVFSTYVNQDDEEEEFRYGGVYVYDRTQKKLENINRGYDGSAADGAGEHPSISADGRYVAFSSDASNLVPGTDSRDGEQVYVYDRTTQTMERISKPYRPHEEFETRGRSFEPVISGDGRFVAFFSYENLLVPEDTNFVADVFLYDRTAKTIKRLNVGKGGQQEDSYNDDLSISHDGSVVAFVTGDDGLTEGDANGEADVVVYSQGAPGLQRVSLQPNGQPFDGASGSPYVSPDGRYVAFMSDVEGGLEGERTQKSFVADLTARATAAVEVAGSPFGPMWSSMAPALSSQAQEVAFTGLYEVANPTPLFRYTFGVFIASKEQGSVPVWPAGSTLQGTELTPRSVRLTWSPAQDAKGVTGYQIYSNGTPLASVAAAPTTYEVTGLEPGMTYTFGVEAVNADRLSSTGGPTYTVKTPSDGKTVKVGWTADQLIKKSLARIGSTLTLQVVGPEGRSGEAQVAYKAWENRGGSAELVEQSAKVALSEAAGQSGRYTGAFTIAEGVAEVTGIRVSLGTGAEAAVGDAPNLPLAVGSAVEVNIHNPGSIPLDGYHIEYKRGDGSYRSEKITHNPMRLAGLLPQETYQFTIQSPEYRYWEIPGSITTRPGITETITGTIPEAAQFRVKLVDQHGQPVPNVSIQLWNQDHSETRGALYAGEDGLTEWQETDDAKEVFQLEVDLKGRYYDEIGPQTVTLNPGSQEKVIVLHKPEEGVLRGQVTAPDGRPLLNATVTATSTYKGKPEVRTARTNLNGEYTLTLLENTDGSETLIRAFQPSYMYIQDEGVTRKIVKGENPRLDLALKGSGYGEIILNVFNKPLGSDWQGPLNMEQVHAQYKVESARGWKSGYYTNIISFMGEPGETVNVCVTGTLEGVGTACDQVALDEQASGTATIRMEQKGGRVQGEVDLADSRVDTQLYLRQPDGSWGSPVAYDGFRGTRFDLYAPQAGEYRLTMSRSKRGANSSGYEYASQVFTLAEGEFKQLGKLTFEETRYFSNHYGNELMALPNRAVPGGKLTLRAAFNNPHAESLTDGQLTVTIPDGLTLLRDAEGRIAAGGAKGEAVWAGGKVTVPVGTIAGGAKGAVTLQAQVADDLNKPHLSLEARLSGQWKGAALDERLGSLQVEAPRVTLEAPERIKEPKVELSGFAPAGSRVAVYDTNSLIGETLASPAGLWRTEVELIDLGGEKLHALHASAVARGVELKSDPKYVEVDPEFPELLRMAMGQLPNGKWIELDVRKGVARMPYTVVPGHPFELELKFDDPSRVRNVQLYMDGQYGQPIAATLGADGLFHAEVPTTSGALGGIYVSYDGPVKKTEYERRAVDMEEVRSQLPAAMRDFVVESSEPFELRGGVYASKVTLSFPQLPNLTMSVTTTMKPGSAYKPTEAEIADAEATGNPLFQAAVSESETEKSLTSRITGYMPTQLVFPDDPSLAAGGKSKSVVSKLDIGLEVPQKYAHMAEFVTEVHTEVKGPYDQINSIKSQYSDYKTYAGKINKIMYGVETSLSCPAAAVETGKEAGMALLATVGGEVAKTAISAWQGAMALEGPAGVVAGFAGDIVKGKIDKYVDAKIDAVGSGYNECIDEETDYYDPLTGLWKKRKSRKIADPKWIYDPSGYVYEAVESNRLSGVTATVLYLDTATGQWKKWDAEEYEQINPQSTDPEGRYGWDVPVGRWKVKWELPGYETAYSAEMDVPPPHLDVNSGLVSKQAPEIVSVQGLAYEGGSHVELTLSKHVRAAELDNEAIRLTDAAGEVIEGTLTAAQEETSPTGEKLTRTLKFAPASPQALAEGGVYGVQVRSSFIISYAGIALNADYTGSVTVVRRDGQAPELQKGSLDGGNRMIRLMFNEKLDASYAPEPGKFIINGAADAVASVFVNRKLRGNEAEAEQEVVLTLHNRVAEGAAVQLDLQPGAVRDLAGNLSGAGRITVTSQGSPLSADAELSALAVKGGTLSPSFGPTRTDYVLTVPERTGSVQVQATTAHAKAKLFIAGNEAVSGASGTVQLPADGQLKIRVQAEDGIHSREYVLTVRFGQPGGEEEPNGCTSGCGSQGSGGPGGSGSQPDEPGKPFDLMKGAAVTPTKDAAGRKKLQVGVKADTIESALKANDIKRGFKLDIGEQADEYVVQFPAEAFRSLSAAGAEVKLSAGALQLRLQAASFTAAASGGETIEVRIAKAAGEQAKLWLSRFGSGGILKPVSDMFTLGVYDGRGKPLEAAPGAKPLQALWTLAPSEAGAGKAGAYRYEAGTDRWTYVGGEEAAEAGRKSVAFDIRAAGWFALLQYKGGFADMSGHWAEAQVNWMAMRQYVDGYSPDSFRPEQAVNRAEFTAMLVRLLALETAAVQEAGFTDVASGAWYAGAVNAAAAAGIVTGAGASSFEPGRLLTREEMTAMVVRAYRSAGGSESLPTPEEQDRLLADFADREQLQPWAREAVAFARKAGLVQGVSPTAFEPAGTATRAQAAVLLQRLAEKRG
ncbi:WD40-like Beta Propeller Repeat [Paenibacillus sp. UNCCL117]|uniref:S-layer homology domain-containing protein n=1 Tax=unclassified Paenibacillus TaxID=185978 RepID=UPI000886CA98|nr:MULTISPECIES: S-layer homology domain-containing protein [unclassified Paenibacillus]SDD13462.1 WD40-like Beta Propeller Repeat [Paenibacillus sp. cl123]SFW33991.1 WD40-like Beta Propeller Repeat [Paenibacillus sp. UNCCL117]